MSIDQRAKPRIIIMIDGGLVTGVYGDNLPDGMIRIDVIRVDYDVDGCDPDDVVTIDGARAYFAVDTLEQAPDHISTEVGRAYFSWGLS